MLSQKKLYVQASFLYMICKVKRSVNLSQYLTARSIRRLWRRQSRCILRIRGAALLQLKPAARYPAAAKNPGGRREPEGQGLAQFVLLYGDTAELSLGRIRGIFIMAYPQKLEMQLFCLR